MSASGPTPSPDPADGFISGMQARRMLAVGYSGLQRLAVLRKVGVLLELGVSPRYSLPDVLKLAESRRPRPESAPIEEGTP